ncbi:MAG: hypothetical protein Q9168_003096 [Polycauliona sp. 1 TL-2023]
MPKQKQFLKAQRKSTKPKDTWVLIWKKPEKNGEQVILNIDDIQSVRIPNCGAGDAQKSARFFLRALEDYDNGLQKFPDSFDLAYNR